MDEAAERSAKPLRSLVTPLGECFNIVRYRPSRKKAGIEPKKGIDRSGFHYWLSIHLDGNRLALGRLFLDIDGSIFLATDGFIQPLVGKFPSPMSSERKAARWPTFGLALYPGRPRGSNC
jgi:hypothetical protein